MSAGATTTQPACPRCGADGHGAAWCPSCGLNLRTRPAGAAPAAAEQPDAPSPPRAQPEAPPRAPLRPPQRSLEDEGRRPSVVALIAVLGVLAVGGIVFGVLALTGDDDGPGTAAPTATATPAEPTATPEVPALAASTVDEAAMTDVLVSYQDAYSAEDSDALASLFATDLVRLNADEPPQDVHEALATYDEQFASLSNPTYRLSNVEFTEGEGEGSASGTYEIVHDAGSASGGIAFNFVRTDDGLLIDTIAVEPIE
jgi:ketosteroid isomerase-like protein